MAAIYGIALTLGALVLAGCTPARYVFKCTVTQPQNCN